MRYLLTIAILLMATSVSSVNLKTYTGCESGCDYTSVQAAETEHQQDLVANDSALTFEIQNTWASPDGGTLISGWTTDATRFLTITAVGAAKASATWSTTAYRAVSSSGIIVREAYTVIDGIQARITTGFDVCFQVLAGGSNTTIKNCFANGDDKGTSRGIRVNDNSLTGIRIYNNVVIDCTAEGIVVLTAAAGGVKIDNNTVENCGTGIETSADDGIARNNIVWNVTTPFVGNWNTTTLSEENYTDAGSISYGSCGSCGTGDQLSQSDPFVSIAGEDYHLVSGATAIDAGKDLSGDFTDDIDGSTRDANFDKGADEFGQVTIISGTTDIEDTFLNEDNPNHAEGGEVLITVRGGSGMMRALVRIKNLSTLIPANATITKAELLYFLTSGANGSFDVFSIWKPWVEGDDVFTDNDDGDATWNDWASDEFEWGTAGCASTNDAGSDNSIDGGGDDRKATAESNTALSVLGWVTIDLTNALVQSWYDGTKNEEGVLLKDVTAGPTRQLVSTEGTSGNLPYAVIEYTLAAADGGTTLGGVTLEGVTIE